MSNSGEAVLRAAMGSANRLKLGLFDLCALALRNGFTATGLPISLQIVCRGYEEATALRIGWSYQDATDWHLRRPPDERT